MAGSTSGQNRSSIISCILLLIVLGFCILLLSRISLPDGNIGVNITDGKIKVDIIDGEENTLIGDVLDFVGDEEGRELYFQPGATYHTEGFRVKNIGEIPVNYRMDINGGDEDSKLIEALEIYLTDDPARKEASVKLRSFEGALAVGETGATYYLVVYMKEDAGNEYQGLALKGVGITVYAVQSNAEESNG